MKEKILKELEYLIFGFEQEEDIVWEPSIDFPRISDDNRALRLCDFSFILARYLNISRDDERNRLGRKHFETIDVEGLDAINSYFYLNYIYGVGCDGNGFVDLNIRNGKIVILLKNIYQSIKEMTDNDSL